MKKLILLTLLVPFIAWPCDDGIVQHNFKEVPEHSILSNGMTEADFLGTIKKFENYFAPLIERDHRSELIVYKSWSSNTINAYADKKPRRVEITVFGGLARYKSMTNDSLMLTLCHELGHHFGGYPKKSGNKWSSAEGQADYYSTAKCLRRVWEADDNIAIMSKVEVPALVKNECELTYKSEGERALCARMSLAGKGMALLFQYLESDSIEPKFETPEREMARAMNYMHPFAQCRLDTYFQGAVCSVPESIEFENDDETTGACHGKLGFTRGLRPGCWFFTRR